MIPMLEHLAPDRPTIDPRATGSRLVSQDILIPFATNDGMARGNPVTVFGRHPKPRGGRVAYRENVLVDKEVKSRFRLEVMLTLPSAPPSPSQLVSSPREPRRRTWPTT